jgi:ornithine cyclodeaminase
MNFHLLSEGDVRLVLPIADLLDPMEHALAGFSAGRVVQPLRSVVPVAAGPGFLGFMPAYLPDRHALGAKLVTVFGGNVRAGLPSHLAVIVLLDERSGRLRAITDGRYITEVRTAAVSAVAARYLARSDASDLAILGSGVQARSHLLAMAAVRPLAAVRVWSPDAAHRERFVADMQPQLACPLVASSSAEDCVRDADLIVAATSSRTPVVGASGVKDGAHVTAVGACRPDERELDPALVARSRLFVDSRESALQEAGDVLLGIRERVFAPDVICAEIGEVIAGRAQGRRGPGEVTIFKSLGLAIEDVVAAEIAYTRALERGIGQTVEL